VRGFSRKANADWTLDGYGLDLDAIEAVLIGLAQTLRAQPGRHQDMSRSELRIPPQVASKDRVRAAPQPVLFHFEQH
jgi:hypothetical protein